MSGGVNVKIRKVIIVLGIFGLLAGSLYGNSHTLLKTVTSAQIGNTAPIIGQSPISPTPNTNSSLPQKPVSSDSSSSTTSSSSSSNSASALPNTDSTLSNNENLVYSEIQKQAESSGHYKLFPTMIRKGPSVKDPQGEHYGDSCIRCHSAVKILVDPSAKLDDFFSGGKYANQTEGINCQVCHLVTSNTYKLRTSGWESCGSCHVNSGGNPTPGNEVHHPQFQMIQGVEIADILPMPSYKYKYLKNTFSCTDCHITNKVKHDFMVPGVTITHDSEGIRRTDTEIDYQAFKAVFNQDKCAVCHPSSADMVNRVKNEQEIISKRLAELKLTYDEWSKRVTTMDSKDPKVQAFKDGATFYTFVDSDGSKGVHNFPYAQALLDKADSYWKVLKQ